MVLISLVSNAYLLGVGKSTTLKKFVKIKGALLHGSRLTRDSNDDGEVADDGVDGQRRRHAAAARGTQRYPSLLVRRWPMAKRRLLFSSAKNFRGRTRHYF